MVASTRGATSRSTGSMPMTRSAAISSRMVRAPRSEQMAEPPAPDSSSAVMIGAACWTIAMRVDRADDRRRADLRRPCPPTSMTRIRPNGMVMRIVGSRVTETRNQVCSAYSRQGKVRRTMPHDGRDEGVEDHARDLAEAGRGGDRPSTRPAGRAGHAGDLPDRAGSCVRRRSGASSGRHVHPSVSRLTPPEAARFVPPGLGQCQRPERAVDGGRRCRTRAFRTKGAGRPSPPARPGRVAPRDQGTGRP